VQINSVPLSLIDFRKFITGDEKWMLYDNPKRRKSWMINPHRTRNPIVFSKTLVCKGKGTELICTSNI